MSSPERERILAEIERLREERNAVILAHFYQEPEIQDIADHVGDSLALARAAQRTDADVIVFCGVHFMAETAYILNPDRTVLLPDLEAGCSLAESCTAEELAAFKARHPDHKVVSYVNTTAEVKALSDIVCTSSNAAKVVASFPPDQPLIFAPDRNLGAWVQRVTGRKLLLWPGSCSVHVNFSLEALERLKAEHPEAEVLAHPECEPPILERADHVGSTAAMIRHAAASDAPAFIVATEPGILHQMQREVGDKPLYGVPGIGQDCPCNVCPYMRRITLEKVLRSLQTLEPRIVLDEELRLAALRPLERMLALS